MQLIYLTYELVEEYEKAGRHGFLAPPSVCPNCGAVKKLHAHGNYMRYTTGTNAGTPRIPIRRFLCSKCRRTVSLLPSFAQPYRLVLNVTIEAFVAGFEDRPDVRRWAARVRQYWSRYIAWLPVLRLRLREMLGRIRHQTAEAVWDRVVRSAGGLGAATHHLVSNFGITVFGAYRCHLPNPP